MFNYFYNRLLADPPLTVSSPTLLPRNLYHKYSPHPLNIKKLRLKIRCCVQFIPFITDPHPQGSCSHAPSSPMAMYEVNAINKDVDMINPSFWNFFTTRVATVANSRIGSRKTRIYPNRSGNGWLRIPDLKEGKFDNLSKATGIQRTKRSTMIMLYRWEMFNFIFIRFRLALSLWSFITLISRSFQ